MPPAPPGEAKRDRRGFLGKMFGHKDSHDLEPDPISIDREEVQAYPQKYPQYHPAPRPAPRQMNTPLPMNEPPPLPASRSQQEASSQDFDAEQVRAHLGLNASENPEFPNEPRSMGKAPQFNDLKPRHEPTQGYDDNLSDELPELEPVGEDTDFTVEPEPIETQPLPKKQKIDEPLQFAKSQAEAKMPEPASSEPDFDPHKSMVPEELLKDSTPDYKSIDESFDKRHEFRNVETPHPPTDIDWSKDATPETEEAPAPTSFTEEVQNHAEVFEKPVNHDFLQDIEPEDMEVKTKKEKKAKTIKSSEINKLEKEMTPREKVMTEEPEEVEQQEPEESPAEEDNLEPEYGEQEELSELPDDLPDLEYKEEEPANEADDIEGTIHPEPDEEESSDDAVPDFPDFDEEPARGITTKPDLGELEAKLVAEESTSQEEEAEPEPISHKSKHKKIMKEALEKHHKIRPEMVSEPAAKLTNAYKARIKKKVREEERASLMVEVDAEKADLRKQQDEFRKKQKELQEREGQIVEKEGKLDEREEKLKKEREHNLKIKDDVKEEREFLQKEKTEYKEIKPKLTQLRHEHDHVKKQVEALRGKIALNEKLEKSLVQRENALKEAEQALKVMEQSIRRDGFSNYLQSELSTKEVIYPKYSGHRDELGVPGGEVYKLVDECRSMLWQSKFDDAKMVYMKARELYQQMVMHGEREGVDEVYNALRLLYDDINLAIIKG